MAQNPVTLKSFYYLDHFFEMVAFLREHYPKVEEEAEGIFLRKFENLGRDAQALTVRLANRRGRVFVRDSLTYDEIEDHRRSLSELEEGRLIRPPAEKDHIELIHALTKTQLLDFLKSTGVELRGLRSLGKQTLIEKACELCCFDQLKKEGQLDQFVIQRHVDDLAFLNFLFFGRLSEGRQSFTLRDLGILKTRPVKSAFKPRYPDIETAREAFGYARLVRKIREADEEGLRQIATTVPDWPERRKDRSIALLGGQFEKLNLRDEALEVYQQSQIHPARERRCRLLFSKGERAGVRVLLKEIIADPSSDEELLFAEDFYRLKYSGKTVGKLTSLLREAPVIKVDEAFKDGSERAAILYYGARGLETHSAENHFWMTLFGTLFWDELQDLTPNEFDARPTRLLDGSFGECQVEEISRKLGLIGTPAASKLIHEVFANHYGEPSGLFQWGAVDEAVLIRFLERANSVAVVAALRRIIEDPRTNSRGYPDLLQFADDGVHFIEIKAEGDQIRRHQLVQIQALQACGFEVSVVRVEWCVDPMQEYVVVDLETTGGRPEYHRVTEIGALKIRDGKVVDTFETLLDPGRRIPPKITQLTGITNEMVEGKPSFAEIADDFHTFVGEAIFVAHSVNFDYGFLRREFERVGREFRRPTLCTVVAMRKFFPGLPSYGLGNLCKEFGIELRDHHRALCDARATAKLLQMVNEKRLARE